MRSGQEHAECGCSGSCGSSVRERGRRDGRDSRGRGERRVIRAQRVQAECKTDFGGRPCNHSTPSSPSPVGQSYSTGRPPRLYEISTSDPHATRSKVASHDAPSSTPHRHQARRPFRAIRADTDLHVRPCAYRETRGLGTDRRVRCIAVRCGEEIAVLEVRHERVQRHVQARNEAGSVRPGSQQGCECKAPVRISTSSRRQTISRAPSCLKAALVGNRLGIAGRMQDANDDEFVTGTQIINAVGLMKDDA